MRHKVVRTEVKCLNCKTILLVTKVRILAGRGKYCSKACLAKVVLKDKAVKFKKGDISWNKGKAHLAIRGEKHYKYKGGFWIDEDGYKVIEQKRLGEKYRIPEHRLVMEQYLNRKLKRSEDIHHIDHNKLNNNPVNLIVLSKREHTLLHRLERQVIPHPSLN